MKKLITAEEIKELHKTNVLELVCPFATHIVTPEARTVAKELGVALIDSNEVKNSKPVIVTPVVQKEDATLKAIRDAVIKQLPEEHRSNESLISQLVDKVIKQGGVISSGITKAPTSPMCSIAKGIKHVDGSSLAFANFAGAGEGKSVGVVDAIGTADNSPMAAGFMQWENCFFPWTLTYDEINYVIEGELHIRSNGHTFKAKKGDVFYIPKGSNIEFGTPTLVKFLFVTYPSNWAE